MARLRQRAGRLHDGDPGSGWPRAGGEIGELSSVLRQAMIDRAASDAAASDLAHKMASVLAAAPIGIAFTRARRFELVSREFAELLGYDEAALAGRATREIYASEEEFLQLGPAVGEAFATGRAYFGELRFLRRDGGLFWGRLQGRPVEAGNPDAGTIWLLEDVTDQRANRERLAWAATHDALTRLNNREAFEVRLAELLATMTTPTTEVVFPPTPTVGLPTVSIPTATVETPVVETTKPPMETTEPATTSPATTSPATTEPATTASTTGLATTTS